MNLEFPTVEFRKNSFLFFYGQRNLQSPIWHSISPFLFRMPPLPPSFLPTLYQWLRMCSLFSPFWFYVFGHPVFRLRLPCRLRPHHMHNSEILSCMNYRQQVWIIIVSNYTRWQNHLQGYWCDSGFDGGNLTRLSNIRVIIMRKALVPIFIISCHAFVPQDY
jgi:hypothetical protein